MPLVRLIAAAMIFCGLLVAGPAPASAAAVTITGEDVTYVPIGLSTEGPAHVIHLKVITPDEDTHVYVDSLSDGEITAYGQPCRLGGGVTERDCLMKASPDPQYIGITFDQRNVIINVEGNHAWTATATAALVSEGPVVAASHFYVRPSSDLQLSGATVDAAKVSVTLRDHGPSTNVYARLAFTGFHRRTTAALPTGCLWTAALTVTCALQLYTTKINGTFAVPIAPGDRGCAFRATVEGNFADPVPANNTATVHATAYGCGAAAATPTHTPAPSNGTPTTAPPTTQSPAPGTPAPGETPPAPGGIGTAVGAALGAAMLGWR